MTLAMQEHQATPGGEMVRDGARREIDDVFLDVAREDDFTGVQTYTRTRYGPQGILDNEEGVEQTQLGYEFWPEALGATIRYAASYTGKPILVTENGIGTDDDARRIEYVRLVSSR